jgi:uncharacterized protein YndB with AHSA1/START domain
VRPGDRAVVTTFVAVSPHDAFSVFTDEIDRWWKGGPRFRQGELRFADGRLIEVTAGERFEIGRVLVWEPGERLVFEWRARSFAPGEITEVEVRFQPERIADRAGTRVTVEHRGWGALGPSHTVRDGLPGPAFTDRIGLWWGELITGYRRHAGS